VERGRPVLCGCRYDQPSESPTKLRNLQLLNSQRAILAETNFAVNFDTLRLEEILKVHHDTTGTGVVPHDRASEWLARLAAPHNGCLALIGDAYSFRNQSRVPYTWRCGYAPMTFTELRAYPASSSFAMACSMTLSQAAISSLASCSCHLGNHRR
jgi:hypothetical protein